MTALLPHVKAEDDIATETPVVLASWPARAGAFGIDVLFGAGVLATLALVAWSTAQGGWLWWVCLLTGAVVLLAIAVNRLLLPALIGSSLGRSIFGIAVVRADGGEVGPWRLLVRDLAHVLDTVPVLIGWLWPLWDARGRTFADLLVGTEVHRVASTARRRLTGALLAAAAVLALAAAGLGYLTVYRNDLAISQAREQLAVQGPKIVENMLSYNAASAQADFGRARSLVTDGYRPQLVTQQQAVQKAGIVSNEYWVTNSAVLDATADHATMLLLLQGQRGEPPKQRFITATARVSFEKSGDGDWRVADLSVLAKPQAEGAPVSPRRKAGPGFAEALPKAHPGWLVAAVAALSAVAIIASITVSALVLITHEKHRRAVVADVAVISYVRSFMTQYTSPDPFHANDYANAVSAQTTGQLAQLYKDKMNEIVIQVAQAEPTKGDVLDAGIERWNDDGTASVVVATKTTTTMPDGKKVESGNRWVATAAREGDQWKISNLLQVI